MIIILAVSNFLLASQPKKRNLRGGQAVFVPEKTDNVQAINDKFQTYGILYLSSFFVIFLGKRTIRFENLAMNQTVLNAQLCLRVSGGIVMGVTFALNMLQSAYVATKPDSWIRSE